jgi:hypothetical protein
MIYGRTRPEPIAIVQPSAAHRGHPSRWALQADGERLSVCVIAIILSCTHHIWDYQENDPQNAVFTLRSASECDSMAPARDPGQVNVDGKKALCGQYEQLIGL